MSQTVGHRTATVKRPVAEPATQEEEPVRNFHRSRHSQRPDGDREAAGVGEFRAVAERLLETGAHYLEQGREWLHAATRRQAHDQDHPEQRRDAAFDDDHRGTRRSARGYDGPRGGRDEGPYAPDEYSFSETGGVYDRHGGRHDEGPVAYGFEAELDDPLHRRARPGGGRRHPGGYGGRRGAGWRGQDDDDFLPGSYGFGGEGRHQPGDLPDSGAAAASGRWERAYREQGRASYRGRGPRGYVRSDERILEDVHERLCDDPIVDATDIEVHCDQGHVVLSGRVPMRWMKHRAEDIVDSLPGVKDIDNRIRVSAEEPVAQGDFDTSRTTGAAFEAPRTVKQDPDRNVAARGARSAEKKEPGAGQSDSSTVSTPGPSQAH